jgi:hypothetical protein
MKSESLQRKSTKVKGVIALKFYILRPSKFYPKWDLGFENIPSGSPGPNHSTEGLSKGEKKARQLKHRLHSRSNWCDFCRPTDWDLGPFLIHINWTVKIGPILSVGV